MLSALLPLAERKWMLLPVNPGIREDVLWVSILLAALSGLGGYQTTRRLGTARLGWSALVLSVFFLGTVLGLAAVKLTFGLSPSAVALAVRMGYVAFFASVGVSFGSFLALVNSPLARGEGSRAA
jgi:hypothetical protein